MRAFILLSVLFFFSTVNNVYAFTIAEKYCIFLALGKAPQMQSVSITGSSVTSEDNHQAINGMISGIDSIGDAERIFGTKAIYNIPYLDQQLFGSALRDALSRALPLTYDKAYHVTITMSFAGQSASLNFDCISSPTSSVIGAGVFSD